jgi:Na+/H+ antiporter NhaD/arsenite permease-like protein
METFAWAWPHFVLIALFIVAIVAILKDDVLVTHKAMHVTIIFVVMLVIAQVFLPVDLDHALADLFMENYELIFFLASAMVLVDILDSHGFFDFIRDWLFAKGLTDRWQFVIIMTITFFMSAVLDNLTVTLAMVQLSVRFFQGRNRLIASSGVVILANSGGAWSPIGDVTTLMIWLEEKFTAWEVVWMGIGPSLAMGAVATVMLMRKLEPQVTPDTDEPYTPMHGRDKFINALALTCFALPLVFHLVLHLPPFIGLLGGQAVVAYVAYKLDRNRPRPDTPMKMDIHRHIVKVEWLALWFLTAIIGCVSVLGAVGILDQLVKLLEGKPIGVTIGGVMALGVISAFVDNVPLTAIALDVIQLPDPGIWALLALAVGTGGSILLNGSAAGIIASEKAPGLDSRTYLRLATPAATVSFAAGMAVWGIQYSLVHAAG